MGNVKIDYMILNNRHIIIMAQILTKPSGCVTTAWKVADCENPDAGTLQKYKL